MLLVALIAVAGLIYLAHRQDRRNPCLEAKRRRTRSDRSVSLVAAAEAHASAASRQEVARIRARSVRVEGQRGSYVGGRDHSVTPIDLDSL